MARVTAEDREREVTIEWTETTHKTLTLPFADMAKLLKIKQGELKAALDEGDEVDTDSVESAISDHEDAQVYEETWEFLEISG